MGVNSGFLECDDTHLGLAKKVHTLGYSLYMIVFSIFDNAGHNNFTKNLLC